MAKPSSLITSIVLVVPGPGSPLAATNAICAFATTRTAVTAQTARAGQTAARSLRPLTS